MLLDVELLLLPVVELPLDVELPLKVLDVELLLLPVVELPLDVELPL